jgi:hypothetical protein
MAVLICSIGSGAHSLCSGHDDLQHSACEGTLVGLILAGTSPEVKCNSFRAFEDDTSEAFLRAIVMANGAIEQMSESFPIRISSV